MGRKAYALELFRQGLAQRILFSVARFEIRRFSRMPLPAPLDLLKLAQHVPPAARHFFVLFADGEVVVQHVRPRRLGTLTEIFALERWLRENIQIRSLMIVSSDAHLRRVRLCCRALLDPTLAVAFVAMPEPRSPAEGLKHRAASVALDLLEFSKVLLYGCVLKFRKFTASPKLGAGIPPSESDSKGKTRH